MTMTPALYCVATHHKGGTVWMKQVFRAFAKALDMPIIGMWSDRQVKDVPQDRPAFLVNWHGWFPRAIWDNPTSRFFHIIRDPRDILLSGWQYHQTAGVKGEQFLHTPRADLNGKTYQQHLNNLTQEQDQILFEMRQKHALTLREMLDWPYDDPRQLTLRYEDLMQDQNCSLFKSALRHLGFGDAAVNLGAQSFWDKSLFGGQSRQNARQGHVQSGAISRWALEMPRAVGVAYENEYGAGLQRLGYSENDTWVNELSVEFTQKTGNTSSEGEINR